MVSVGQDRDTAGRRLTRRGSRHASPETRRTQLLDAAIRCFSEQGYYGTTVDAVANEAGLSKGSLYRFFDSKDDLLMAIVDEWAARAEERWASWKDDPNPLLQLREYGHLLMDQMATHRALVPIWLEFFRHEAPREHMRRMYASARQRLAAGVRAGVRAGQLRDVAPTQAADAIMALLEGIAILAAADPDFDIKRRFAGAWSVLEAGLVKDHGSAETGKRPRRRR